MNFSDKVSLELSLTNSQVLLTVLYEEREEIHNWLNDNEDEIYSPSYEHACEVYGRVCKMVKQLEEILL